MLLRQSFSAEVFAILTGAFIIDSSSRQIASNNFLISDCFSIASNNFLISDCFSLVKSTNFVEQFFWRNNNDKS